MKSNFFAMDDRQLSIALATNLTIDPSVKPKSLQEIWLINDDVKIDELAKTRGIIFEYDYTGSFPEVTASTTFLNYSKVVVCRSDSEIDKNKAKNKAFAFLMLLNPNLEKICSSQNYKKV